MPAIKQYATQMAAALAVLVLSAGTMTQPARAGLDEAMAALDHGDWPTALKELKPLAEAGNPEAQFQFGSMYVRGDGVPVDYSTARGWFEKAAAQQWSDAELALGDLYARGQGVVKSPTLASDWYRKAAQHGNAQAMNNLGEMASSGEGRPADPVEALGWFTGAANKGFSEAQYNLGRAYARGEGVPVDMKTAYMWFRLAANGGDEDALQALQAVAPTLTQEDLGAAEEAAQSWRPQP
jgi:localization factor PodJL